MSQINRLESQALHLLKEGYNHLDVSLFAEALSEDVQYGSQHVLERLNGKSSVIDYLEKKFRSIASSPNRVKAKLDKLTSVFPGRLCLVVSQSIDFNSATVLIKVSRSGLIESIDICDHPNPKEVQES
jgi:hypothetical protein